MLNDPKEISFHLLIQSYSALLADVENDLAEVAVLSLVRRKRSIRLRCPCFVSGTSGTPVVSQATPADV